MLSCSSAGAGERALQRLAHGAIAWLWRQLDKPVETMAAEKQIRCQSVGGNSAGQLSRYPHGKKRWMPFAKESLKCHRDPIPGALDIASIPRLLAYLPPVAALQTNS